MSGLEAIALIWGLCLLALVYLFATARPGWEDESGFHAGEHPSRHDTESNGVGRQGFHGGASTQ